MRAAIVDSTVSGMGRVSSSFSVAVVVAVVVIGGAGCTPAPVAAFEKFYAATAARDVAGFKSSLCTHTRASLAAVPEEALRNEMKVRKVVQKIEVKSASDDHAVLDVVDATGGHESVDVVREDGAWCVQLPEPK